MAHRRRWSAALLGLASATMSAGCNTVTSPAVPSVSASPAPGVSSDPAAASPTADPTGTWTAVSSTEGRFSLRYPSSLKVTLNCTAEVWLDQLSAPDQANCPVAGDTGELLFFFQSVAGDQRNLLGRNEGSFPSEGTAPLGPGSSVTIDGVASRRYTGTFPNAGMGVVAGENQVVYIAYTNGRTYAAIYSQNAGTPDMSADFKLMAEHTLTFAG